MCTRTPTDCTDHSLGVSFFFFFSLACEKLQATVDILQPKAKVATGGCCDVLDTSPDTKRILG